MWLRQVSETSREKVLWLVRKTKSVHLQWWLWLLLVNQPHCFPTQNCDGAYIQIITSAGFIFSEWETNVSVILSKTWVCFSSSLCCRCLTIFHSVKIKLHDALVFIIGLKGMIFDWNDVFATESEMKCAWLISLLALKGFFVCFFFLVWHFFIFFLTLTVQSCQW